MYAIPLKLPVSVRWATGRFDTPATNDWVEVQHAVNTAHVTGYFIHVKLRPVAAESLGMWLTGLRATEDMTVAEREKTARLRRPGDRLIHEVRKLGNHPAYRGLAVPGVKQGADVFDAFLLGAVRAWPTPHMAFTNSNGEYGAEDLTTGVMDPEIVTVRGRLFTRWQFVGDR